MTIQGGLINIDTTTAAAAATGFFPGESG